MFTYAINRLRNLITGKEEGATLAEYGLLVALIAVVCIGVVTTLGTTLKGKFQAVIDGITGT